MTTQELFWKRGVGGYTEQHAVDWALAELEQRAPSAHLAALAGSIPPYNGFEIEDLLKRALREIGGAEPSREESYRDFVCTMVGRILSGELSEREGCRLLHDAHGGDHSRVDIQPFWLLHMAAQDRESSGFQYYDQRFDGHNLEDLVRVEAGRLSTQMCAERTDAVSNE
jgi:hypothetical protein